MAAAAANEPETTSRAMLKIIVTSERIVSNKRILVVLLCYIVRLHSIYYGNKNIKYIKNIDFLSRMVL